MNAEEQKRLSRLVKTVREMIEPENPHTPDELLFVLGVVEELAEKLGVKA